MERSMKFWWLIVLILIAIIPFTLRANMTKKLLFSNKSYAKQIEVKTYILAQEQVAELFKTPDKEPHLYSSNELNNLTRKKRYCVIRVKNLGELNTWGTLSCKIPGINENIKVEIPSIEKYFCDYVICISGVYLGSGENSRYPIVTYQWSELYTK